MSNKRCLQEALNSMIHRPSNEVSEGMNLFEAMKRSKELGGAYIGRKSREGWIRFLPSNSRQYYHLTAEDILAEDWELKKAEEISLQDCRPITDFAK